MATTVGILIYDGVEVLDFSGPYESFSTVNRVARRARKTTVDTFDVYTVARDLAIVHAREGYLVMPRYNFDNAPKTDVLVVPGGIHDVAMECKQTLDYVRRTSDEAIYTVSVCTGAFILARAGLLEGRQATTHWEDLQSLATMFPGIEVVGDARWVESPPFLTSEGVAAGIDVSLHLVAQITNTPLADATARQMCYERRSREQTTSVSAGSYIAGRKCTAKPKPPKIVPSP